MARGKGAADVVEAALGQKAMPQRLARARRRCRGLSPVHLFLHVDSELRHQIADDVEVDHLEGLR